MDNTWVNICGVIEAIFDTPPLDRGIRGEWGPHRGPKISKKCFPNFDIFWCTYLVWGHASPENRFLLVFHPFFHDLSNFNTMGSIPKVPKLGDGVLWLVIAHGRGLEVKPSQSWWRPHIWASVESNQSRKGIIRAVVPLPCFIYVEKSDGSRAAAPIGDKVL